MNEPKSHEALIALPKGYQMHSEKTVDRLKIIDKIPEKLLRVKAMLVAGWSHKEVAARCQVSHLVMAMCLKQLHNPEESLNIIRYLEELFADNEPGDYKPDMGEIGEITEILSGWDSKAVSKLADDLRSGKLAQQYTAAAEPGLSVPASDRIAPPGGQLYTDRPDRKETAPQFIERVYGGAGWLTGAFTRADLRKIDSNAAMGLANWERSNGRATLNLPTLKERNDRLLADPQLSAASPITKLHDVQRARQRRADLKTK